MLIHLFFNQIFFQKKIFTYIKKMSNQVICNCFLCKGKKVSSVTKWKYNLRSKSWNFQLDRENLEINPNEENSLKNDKK